MHSLAVTAYNEITGPQLYGQRLLNCIRPAQVHDAIGEIVIVDDGSPDFDKLEDLLRDQPKVKLFRNATRMGVFTNKVEAIARSTGEWVVTCDSDNVMDAAYLDLITGMTKQPWTWYCPSWGKPVFDYRTLVGTYGLSTIGAMLARPMAQCAINTGNQTVHHESFVHVFERFVGVRRFDLLLPNYMDRPEAERQEDRWWLAYGACDSFLLNLIWLETGALLSRRLEFVAGLEYDHYVHSDPEGSNYDRAPDEKAALSTFLVQMLQDLGHGEST